MKNKSLTGTNGAETKISEADQRVISELLKTLKKIFPSWRYSIVKQQEIYDIQEIWTKELLRSNLTNHDHIKRGINYAKQSPTNFFPTVYEFIRWCMAVAPMRVRVWGTDEIRVYLREKYLREFGCYCEDNIPIFSK